MARVFAALLFCFALRLKLKDIMSLSTEFKGPQKATIFNYVPYSNTY